ncbi:hypothetical protein [Actinomadura sp. 7K507]|uniref:hypothetical protein n=1 Tax=Actinomadura sp. 7K507 TaxID=2530365 RepID=UPI00104DC321|nr:hypothetical protein [Actinomadura sp. 7K507]TDC89256.1 hypothetical protein E1285_16815 [Actinomadura sp. 7K507]
MHGIDATNRAQVPHNPFSEPGPQGCGGADGIARFLRLLDERGLNAVPGGVTVRCDARHS